ncbi:hypothetical protein PFICI_01590 [Pestalotiopsis fici W106-1]|uniref:Rhodopsin domain-containing protein n=1 Tax=Pestalotiopsis fici (strain W106-1 / CGMCC3.15140) TaxID=1229662 RepID=W3XQH6_PESFW|nr:uncharacterized protein PFICI_01590 [Pestalotiopsis fici W106-1]ETS87762.1 hypothetical protein PFICI_01590 [Pestalotiopsis fici W106-1]
MDFDNTPAMEAPPGFESNLVNPDSRATTRVVVSSVALAIVAIFVPIRVFVRYKIGYFNSEDWVLLFATAAFIVLESMLMIVSLYGGDGTHLWDISLSRLFDTLYYENIAEIMYCTTMFPIKYVMLHQVKSIFFAHDRRSPFHRIIVVLIWANLLLYVALGLAFIFGCTPREKIWHPMIEGRCISVVTCMSAGGALNIASDASVLIIPLFGISKLQLPLKKKLLASSVFAIGVFATAAAIVRFYYGLQLLTTEDTTWVFMDIGNWTTIEFMMGFIVAGAPYVPRLLENRFSQKSPSQVTPAIVKTTFYSSKVMNRTDGQDAGWSALREQDDMPFDGTTQAYSMSNKSSNRSSDRSELV